MILRSNLSPAALSGLSIHGNLESGLVPACKAWLSTLKGSPTLPGLCFSHVTPRTLPVEAFNAITLVSSASEIESKRDFATASSSPVCQTNTQNIIHTVYFFPLAFVCVPWQQNVFYFAHYNICTARDSSDIFFPQKVFFLIRLKSWEKKNWIVDHIKW